MAAYNLRYIYLAVFVCLNIVKAYFPDLVPEFGDMDLLLPLSGWTGTWYVKKIDGTIYYKSASIPTAADASVGDLEAVVELEAVTTGDTVYVCTGTFEGTEIDSDSLLDIDKQIIFSAAPGDEGKVILDFNGASGNGVRPSVHCETPGTCGVYGLVLKGMATASTNYSLYSTANNWHFDVEIDGGGRGVYCGSASDVFDRLYIHGTASRAIYSTVAAIYNRIILESCYQGFAQYNNNGSTINNIDIYGSTTEAIENNGTGEVTVNNLLVWASAWEDATRYPIKNNSTGVITVNSGLVLPSPTVLTHISTGGTVNLNNVAYKMPLIRQSRRPAIVVFGVDDLDNLAYMQTVAAKLAAYGWKGTYALNKPSTVTDWTPIQALVAAGHTIAAHGETYSNTMTDRLGLSMTYAGAATAADCSVTGAGDYATGLSCVNDASTVIDLNLTLAANNTLDKIVAVINTGTGTHGYTAAKRNTDGGNAVASKYLKTQSLDVKAGAKNFDLDDDRVFNGEMRDVKAAIEAGIGSTISGWVCPGNVSDATMRTALLTLGFTGARGDGLVSSYLMSSINIFNISPVALYLYFGNDADPQNTAGKIEQYIGSTLEHLKWAGGVYFFFAHSTSEFTAAAWDALLPIVQKSGIQVMTLDQAVSYLKTYDPSGDLATADNLTYTRTMVNAADYRLKAGSPAINAGTDVGLTTDFLGKPTKNPPSIGAYEYFASKTKRSKFVSQYNYFYRRNR
jgi:hypothetical protein